VASNHDFPIVFEQLKTILKPYAQRLTLTTDAAEAYSIDGPYSQKWKKQLFFASTVIKKNYVSFYLMPVYMYPELLDHISPGLKKRMQGKSCFNFTKIDEALFAELQALTARSIANQPAVVAEALATKSR